MGVALKTSLHAQMRIIAIFDKKELAQIGK
jgi:hypothetical protein